MAAAHARVFADCLQFLQAMSHRLRRLRIGGGSETSQDPVTALQDLLVKAEGILEALRKRVTKQQGRVADLRVKATEAAVDHNAQQPLVILDQDALVSIVNRLASRDDAGRLACVCTHLRCVIGRCITASKWPLMLEDGGVREPPSGQYHAVAEHKNGFQGIIAALKRLPVGGSLLVEPGDYIVPAVSQLIITEDCHVFARGAIFRKEFGRGNTRAGDASAVLTCVSRRGSISGAAFAPAVNKMRACSAILIKGSFFRAQHCTVVPGCADVAVKLGISGGPPVIAGLSHHGDSSSDAPAIIGCVISGEYCGITVETAYCKTKRTLRCSRERIGLREMGYL